MPTEIKIEKWLRLPVVSAGAEYLVMGHLMRRNILAYKAPQNNEGYDLICIHPNPRRQPASGELAQVRVQVKSRYASDCDRGFPVKEISLNAFDFLIVVFLNIGKFFGKNDGSIGSKPTEFYTLPNSNMNIFYALLSIIFGIGTFAFQNPVGVPIFGLAFAAAGFIREFRGQKRVGIFLLLGIGTLICAIGAIKIVID